MKWMPYAAALLSVSPIVGHSAVYLTTEQAQQLMFPNSSMKKVTVHLTADQIKSLKKSSGIYYAFKADQVYKSSDGGWMVIDQVLGKHEMITYAVALTAKGVVKQVEILQYNESYGGQVRDASWRQQFIGKTSASKLVLNQDIKNISGATLSSKHITDGVKRILQFYQLVLQSLG
ncbi:FMN-binding protein [Acinetobacter bouvetii]|uniref:Electron transport complex subunit RsxG n=1 Tax=Acinetobacter bouvetii TaxID=202951 RepID=A0A811GAQ7_9GAMM|nr:FMN-binding protein [Acinetobacter bouvetii]CAB1213283.1 Electron transport complex subunit RsxG [Acinetobacter bouvetii]